MVQQPPPFGTCGPSSFSCRGCWLFLVLFIAGDEVISFGIVFVTVLLSVLAVSHLTLLAGVFSFTINGKTPIPESVAFLAWFNFSSISFLSTLTTFFFFSSSFNFVFSATSSFCLLLNRSFASFLNTLFDFKIARSSVDNSIFVWYR